MFADRNPTDIVKKKCQKNYLRGLYIYFTAPTPRAPLEWCYKTVSFIMVIVVSVSFQLIQSNPRRVPNHLNSSFLNHIHHSGSRWQLYWIMNVWRCSILINVSICIHFFFANFIFKEEFRLHWLKLGKHHIFVVWKRIGFYDEKYVNDGDWRWVGRRRWEQRPWLLPSTHSLTVWELGLAAAILLYFCDIFTFFTCFHVFTCSHTHWLSESQSWLQLPFHYILGLTCLSQFCKLFSRLYHTCFQSLSHIVILVTCALQKG